MTYDHDESATDLLVATWQSTELSVPKPAAIPDRLERHVRAGTRRLVLGTIGEVLLTVTVFAIVGAIAGGPTDLRSLIIWALAVIHTALVWGFSIWNRRGLWRPAASDTQAYLALARRRAQRRLQAARFGLMLLGVEAAAAVLALAILADGTVAARLARYAWSLGFGIVFGGAAGAACLRLRKTAQRELELVADVEEERV